MGYGVDFEGSNRLYKGNGEDVADLPVFSNGVALVTCFELSDEEVDEIVRTRRVYHGVLSGGRLYPHLVGSRDSVRSVLADYGPLWRDK